MGVRHGLRNCSAVVDGETVPLPGAVSISLDPKTVCVFDERVRGYGGLIRYENIGYDGKLVLAGIPTRLMELLFGWSAGVEKYVHTVTPVCFSLSYEEQGQGEQEKQGDEKQGLSTTLVCCTAGGYDIKAATDTSGMTFAVVTLDIYARADEGGTIRIFNA